PLAKVPENERQNMVALRTIREHPHLFSVVTPINMQRFGELLVGHPNRALVDSVVRSLTEGVWLWADTPYPLLPVTWDNEARPLSDPDDIAFACEQREREVERGRFSPSFGPDSLPGMYAVPVHVVPKPGTNKKRLVVDHSSGQYPLNVMIPKSRGFVHLDNLNHLGAALR
ncbi:hypothetical protein K523DRAFT_222735, partial [Schizophyllum commune Tattone D]